MTYLLPLIIAASVSVGVKRRSGTVIKMAVIIDAAVMLTILLAVTFEEMVAGWKDACCLTIFMFYKCI
jgi:hypothetical protein